MELKNVIKYVIQPGLKLLPERMNTPRATAMLIAIGLQESRFIHRKQIGGPARGFYQFEKGGGLAGVLSHHSVKDYSEQVLELFEVNKADAFEALTYNDAIATAFARLLLFTDPGSLPSLASDHTQAWDMYLRVWRPGKPHPETFPDFWKKATASVADFGENI